MKANLDSCLRLTIPIDIIRSLETSPGEYARIELRKDSITDYMYFRVPSKPPSRKILQVRRKLSNKVIHNLKLMPNDTLEITGVAKIEKRNSVDCITSSKFDLLSLRLENVMIESFHKNDEEWCRFWSSSKNGGLSNVVELKRYIPISLETGEFFGLMQAESRKVIGKFEFTNTLIDTHIQFIDIAEKLGISRNSWSVGLICRKASSKINIDFYKERFLRETKLSKINYKTESKTLLSAAYQIYISSSILNRIMNGTLVILRKRIIDELNKGNNKNYQDFYKGFIIKYLLGDGTITFPSKSNAQVILTEANAESRRDFQSMLRLFSINSCQQGIKIYISTNFGSLMWFLENNLFIGHTNNRKKLLDYILRNYFFRITYNRLLKVNNTAINEYAELLGLSYNTATMSLHRYKKRGFLDSKKIDGKTMFFLTKKGHKFIELMKQAEIEFSSFDIPQRT